MEPNDISEFLNARSGNGLNNVPRILGKSARIANDIKDDVKGVKRDNLTTKNAVKFLLEGRLKKKVCRYCLNVASPLSELDQILQIAGTGALYKISIRDMVASFHPFKVADDPNFPNRICNKCLNRTISSYLFTQQCERSERALRNCFEDMYNKLEKLDPLEPKQKKRGRQKINPNYNILYTEHEKVIDYAEPIINIVNSGSELLDQEESDGVEKLECLKCWRVFPNMSSLLNHEKLHPKTMYYHCRQCGKAFTKRNQIKKHKKIHELGKQLDIRKSDFKCLECGVVSNDYNEHLQHIEKHKFQMVMEHLIERNMDKLCTVCFDKNRQMVELDKMVCLHGGYPELMGDKTLYNILGSTVPEKSSYKYQELLLLMQAKITSIVKVNSNMVCTKETGECFFKFPSPITIYHEGRQAFDNDYLFMFSSPSETYENHLIENNFNEINEDSCEENSSETEMNTDVLIEKAKESLYIGPFNENNEDAFKENHVIDINNDVLIEKADENVFLCNVEACNASNSLADINTDITIKNARQNVVNIHVNKSYDTCNKNQSLADMDDVLIEKEKENLLIVQNNKILDKIHAVFSNDVAPYSFTFSRPDFHYLEEVMDNKESELVPFEVTKPCKTCWLFKKSTCNQCLNIGANNNVPNIMNANIDSTIYKKKECEYCWLFKNCVSCDYCKKVNKPNNINSYKTNETSQIVTDHAYKSTKRKIPSAVEVTAKRNKWQCQICLTVNTDTNICACCDAQSILNENTMKVNFNYSQEFFSALNKSTYDTSSFAFQSSTNKVEAQCAEMAEANTANINDVKLLINDNEAMSTTDLTQPAQLGIKFPDVNMENEQITLKNKINTETANLEKMEIEEDNSGTVNAPVFFPRLVNFGFSADIRTLNTNQAPLDQPNLGFQFQIGSANAEDRKIIRRGRRPLKKATTSFHNN